jgi:uncharacterized phage-associated protein
MQGFNYRKAIQALNFLAIKEGGTINKMKAIKLIWLSDRAHLRKYGRPILNDHYYAMKHGPVPSNTKDLCEGDNNFLDEGEKDERNSYLKPHDDKMAFDSISRVNSKVFSQTDIETLEEIYQAFGSYDQYDLANRISHMYPEWKKHEETLHLAGESRVDMDYEDFFENPDEDDYFQKISTDLLEESKSKYRERQRLAALFR